MNANDLTSVDQLRSFLDGSQAIVFEVTGNKQARYQWIGDTLIKFQYRFPSRQDKGILIQHLIKISGYSQQSYTVFKPQLDEKVL